MIYRSSNNYEEKEDRIMRRIKRSIIAVTIAATMFSQSLAGIVAAEAPNVDDAVVTEVETTESEAYEVEPTSVEESVPESVEKETEQVASEEETTKADEGTTEEQTTTEEETTTEQQTETATEDELWYDIPDGYTLSAQDMECKAALGDTLDDLKEATPGMDYNEGEVFALVDTQKEADIIADAYNADVVRFDEGVLVMDLSDGITVEEAVSVAADTSINMPVVYPNFIRSTAVYEQVELEDDEVTGDNVAEIADESEDVELEYPVNSKYSDPYLNGASKSYQWQHNVVGSHYAWKANRTGSGIKVAVVDTGVIKSHEDLSIAGVYDCTDNNLGAYDSVGHGTHCIGIISERANGKGGVGIAPDATIYSVRVLDNSGHGSDAAIIRGLNKAIDLKVDVISISITGVLYNSAFIAVANKATNAGIPIFAAAGNQGGQVNGYPAAIPGIFAVAATDQNGLRASFSNYGSYINYSAPGVRVVSTYNGSSSDYAALSGTSMATPVVAGEAAVILASNLPQLQGKKGADKIKALQTVMNSAAKSCGAGMGRGIVSLPKALGLSVDVAAPVKPVITASINESSGYANITLTSKNNNTIIYTVDGTNPSYKNGTLVNGTVYSASRGLSVGTNANSNKIVVKALEINSVGMASPVATYSYVFRKVNATSVTVSGLNSIVPGKSITLKSAIYPKYAVDKKLTWTIAAVKSATDPKALKVTVSSAGKVTAGKDAVIGDIYKVTATSGNGYASGSWTITVRESNITSLKFDATKFEGIIPVQKSIDLTTHLIAQTKDGKAPAASDLEWTSSNEKIVTCSNGTVTFRGPGSAKVTVAARDGSGKKATVTIVVTQRVTSIYLSGPSGIYAGGSANLNTVVYPANAKNKKLEWTVTGDAKISGNKLVVGKNATGKITVKATATDGSGVSSTTITVNVLQGKCKKITPETKTVKVFRTKGNFSSPTTTSVKLNIDSEIGLSLSNYTVSFTNPGIANGSLVLSNGVMYLNVSSSGGAVGTSVFTVAATDGSGKRASVTVKVVEAPTAIKIANAKTGGDLYVAQGKSITLKAYLEGSGKLASQAVTWSVSSTSAMYGGVTITNSGKLTAARTASARNNTYYVTATATDGSKASVTVPVTVFVPTTNVTKNFKGNVVWGTSPVTISYSYYGNYYWDITRNEYVCAGFYPNVGNLAVLDATVGLDDAPGPGKHTVLITFKPKKKGSSALTLTTMDGVKVAHKIIVK